MLPTGVALVHFGRWLDGHMHREVTGAVGQHVPKSLLNAKYFLDTKIAKRRCHLKAPLLVDDQQSTGPQRP